MHQVILAALAVICFAVASTSGEEIKKDSYAGAYIPIPYNASSGGVRRRLPGRKQKNNVICDYGIGKGIGKKRLSVIVKGEENCMNRCAKLKRRRKPTINGVSVIANASKLGCYCEMGMTGVNTTQIEYKTCFLSFYLSPASTPPPTTLRIIDDHSLFVPDKWEFFTDPTTTPHVSTPKTFTWRHVATPPEDTTFPSFPSFPPIPTFGPTRYPQDLAYANFKDKLCGEESGSKVGCYKFKYTDSRGRYLLNYRYDIEWPTERLPKFAYSFVCACHKAAKKAGAAYFATHFWGECWEVFPQFGKGGQSEGCNLADGTYKTNCTGVQYTNECLGSTNYYVYAVGDSPTSVIPVRSPVDARRTLIDEGNMFPSRLTI